MNKYKNKKIKYDGIVFDSIKECNRYKKLKMLESSGSIKELQVHVGFVLIPAQYETFERYSEKTGNRLKDGSRCVETACNYIADFVYKDADGKLVVEDVKSPITRANTAYRIKRKLMRYVHGIGIKEV